MEQFNTDGTNTELDVYTYDGFHNKIGKTFIPQTKESILSNSMPLPSKGTSSKSVLKKNVSKDVSEKPLYPQVEFAIITALYEYEFDEIIPYFEWDEKNDIETETKKYRIGHLKNSPKRKIVAAVPSATGMVDSAILATQMMEFFKPKYLLMSGVCGGKKSMKKGDIVLANKVFTFQKGKLSDLTDASGEPVELFDSEGKFVDYKNLYNENKEKVRVAVEKFEMEHDSIIEINPLVKDKIGFKLETIESYINKQLRPYKKNIKIYFESMACSTMVIDKDGFFEDVVKPVDRKTVALEMESYGVARACQFANDGKTKCVIFKSVMDNMTKKNDDDKRFAARTSAMFLERLVYGNILK